MANGIHVSKVNLRLHGLTTVLIVLAAGVAHGQSSGAACPSRCESSLPADDANRMSLLFADTVVACGRLGSANFARCIQREAVRLTSCIESPSDVDFMLQYLRRMKDALRRSRPVLSADAAAARQRELDEWSFCLAEAARRVSSPDAGVP